MATNESNLSAEDKEFLAKCEEELKDRFTDNDEEFLKVFNSEPSTPPIVESWWIPLNQGRRNDRQNNWRTQPYDRQRYRDNRDHRGNHNRRNNYYGNRGYNDYNRSYDRGSGYQRPQYY